MAISHIPRSVGHNFLPEYQISAIPFMRSFTVSGQTDEGDGVRSFEFSKITQWLSFNSSEKMSVYFCKEDAQAGENGMTINTTFSYPLYIRCTKLYFNNADDGAKTFALRAGLTSIQKDEFSGVVETFLEANN